jgi:hypothetical protein
MCFAALCGGATQPNNPETLVLEQLSVATEKQQLALLSSHKIF